MTIFLNKSTQLLLGSVLLILSLLLFHAHPVKAETVIFQDNFDDNDISDWTIWSNSCRFNGSPAQWLTFSQMLGIKINSGSCSTFIIPSSLTIPTGKEYSYEVDIKLSQDIFMDRNIIFKFQDLSNWYSLHLVGTNISFDKVVGGSQVFPIYTTTYPFQNNGTYHFKINLFSNKIEINIDGNLIATFPEGVPLFQNSNAGLAASAGGIESSEVWFDNLKITEISSNNSLNVPDIKQYSAPWGTQEYDTASSWNPVPQNKTISRWGCALTSATMVLQYYGHDVSPEELNTYLKNHNGFTRQGGVIWPAVTKFTKINDTEESPSLEFTYHSVNDAEIINELETNKRPTIFKLQKTTNHATHFILGKGKKEKDNPNDLQDYFVNDPASSTNSKLSDSKVDFNMELVKYGVFTPSHTDLSYIVLFVDPNVNLKVFDANGNEITDGYLFEGPIIDGVDKTSLGGSGLNAFYYPKPQNGTYKVEVTGQGSYQLDSYLYDQNGDVNVKHTTQTAFLNQKNIFLINSDNQNSQNSHIDQISFSTLLKSLDAAYKNKLLKDRIEYYAIRSYIETAQTQYNKKRNNIAKDLLSHAKDRLTRLKPSQIDLPTRDQLMLQINTLISIL